MKKVMSILVAPLLTLVFLAGCTKVEYTPTNVQDKFVSYIDSYIVKKNNMEFKNNIYPVTSENNEGDTVEVDNVVTHTFEKVMYISYNNEYQLNDAARGIYAGTISEPLNTQYQQLTTVYQRMLSLAFNYYVNWSPNFYANIGNTAIEQEEINELYNKIIDLQEATDSFVAQRKILERAISMIDSSYVNPKITHYSLTNNVINLNSEYNNLLVKVFDFVTYFKDLHKQYIFNGVPTSFNEARRLVDETSLLLSEAIFYDNLLTLSGLDFPLYKLKTEYSTKPFVWIANINWSQLTYEDVNGYLYANSNLSQNVSDEIQVTVGDALQVQDTSEEKTLALSKVRQLYTYTESFAQDLKNYKTLYSSLNTTNYTNYRYLGIPADSVQEQSNLLYLNNFATNKVSTLFAALYSVMAY